MPVQTCPPPDIADTIVQAGRRLDARGWVRATLLAWMDADVKATLLKALQGIL